VHLWPFIAEARRNGAKLVVIDPYKTRTAKSADWYLPINPGTDVALALAMMNVIITEKLHDADYVSKYTRWALSNCGSVCRSIRRSGWPLGQGSLQKTFASWRGSIPRCARR